MSLQSVSVLSYSLTLIPSSATALLNLTVSAELGVSGSISDVAPTASSSRRRSLLSTTTSKPHACITKTTALITTLLLGLGRMCYCVELVDFCREGIELSCMHNRQAVLSLECQILHDVQEWPNIVANNLGWDCKLFSYTTSTPTCLALVQCVKRAQSVFSFMLGIELPSKLQLVLHYNCSILALLGACTM